jgi:hypothetical protein
MADLGGLVVAWMHGDIGGTPGHPAPADPETTPLMTALTTLNRNGFVTDNSQLAETVDGESWNTWVSGFASDATLARMRNAVAGTPLRLTACRGRVHECGRRFPWFPYPSLWQCPGKLAHGEWAGVGRQAAAELATAWWVNVEDPEPGRNDLLWPVLTAALEPPEENPHVPPPHALAVPRPRSGDRRDSGSGRVPAAAPHGGPRGRAVPGGDGNRPRADRRAAACTEGTQARGGAEDDRPQDREEQGMTRATLTEVTGMFGAAASAVTELARNAQPSASNRAISLAGHETVILGLERCMTGIRDVLEGWASALRERAAASGGSDLHAVIIDASRDAGKAFREVNAASHALADTVRETRGQAPRREPRVTVAARAAGEALEAIQGRRYGRAVTVQAHARIAEVLHQMLTDLSSALSHEAILIDWAYETLRRGRESGNVAGPLVKAHRNILAAARRVQVASVVLQDGA